MKILLHWLINTVTLLIVPHIVAGVHVANWTTAFIAALVLGILNVLLKPILFLLTLPVTILTLGLFMFVINALLFSLAAKIVPGFTIANFWSAFWGAFIFTVISFAFNLILRPL